MAWQMLRGIEPELPDALIFPHFTTAQRGGIGLGHFAPPLWRIADEERHQVGINPLTFATPEDALMVLLHEAAHGILWKAEVKGGCSQAGVYHRSEFRDECVRLGLDCAFRDTRYGWNITRWPESGVPARYEPVLGLLREGIQDTFLLARKPSEQVTKTVPRAGRVPLQCGCGRRIYAGRYTAEQGGIQCLFCKTAFRLTSGD